MKLLLFFCVILYVEGEVYEKYSGKKVGVARAKELRNLGIIDKCTVDVKICSPHEGSRVDGTCNNYKYPSTGGAEGPYLRLLKPETRNHTGHNNTEKGPASVPPSPRLVRTTLQPTGQATDKTTFTVAASHYLQFIDADLSSLNGPYDFLKNRKNCCAKDNEKDPRCTPLQIPDEDPYLKVTDIRCLNFSSAETFQHAGCIHDPNTPQQINFQTPLLDLSTIYGVDNKALKRVRQKEYGLLKMEERNGRLFPTTNASESGCLLQDGKLCYNFGYPTIGNTDLRMASFSVFFMREHNRIAHILRELNPCWLDDRLFKIARQINIAAASNIFMYELLPPLLGEQNMLNFGLISEAADYVKAYDEDAVPLVYAEYEVARRYFRTMIDGKIKKYDKNLRSTGELSLSDTMFKTELLEQGKLFEEINRGIFIQNAAPIDDVIDAELSERYYSSIEKAHDLSSDDIQRGREMKVEGYNKYRKLCGLRGAGRFEDLRDVMSIEKITALKKLYKTVDDIELLPGIMSETHISGTYVGSILLCIMAKQYQALRYTDRFWFERGDNIHSLTLPQLREVRKANMARFLCDNAEGISFIQPLAFQSIGPGNTPIPCEHIHGPDLTAWQDSTCNKRKFKQTDQRKMKPEEQSLPNGWINNQWQTKKNQHQSISYMSSMLNSKPIRL